MNYYGPKSEIIKSCRHLYSKELVTSYDGNISYKKADGTFLITKSGVCKKYVDDADIINVNRDREILSGPGECSTEFTTHLTCYDARPDATCVVHAHPIAATSLTFMNEEHLLCEDIVPEAVNQIGNVATVPYLTPGSEKLSIAVQQALTTNPDCNFIMLKQHGIIGIGTDILQVCMHIEKVEYIAKIILNCGLTVNKLSAWEVADLIKYKYPSLK